MRITLIGAGKLGIHLALKLKAEGEQLLQICSRTAQKAEELAARVDAQPCTKLESLLPHADLYLLTVGDDAIEEVARQMRRVLPKNALLAHTSGSQPTDLLGQGKQRRGVFYPLQSFSHEKTPLWENIPFCIHASQPDDEDTLVALARKISPNVYRLNDRQRSELHLAAVFANNFVNYLLTISYELCQKHQIPFELLHPLILETAEKATSGPSPAQFQTGPAVRNDQKTITRHIEQIRSSEKPNIEQLYLLITELLKARIEKEQS